MKQARTPLITAGLAALLFLIAPLAQPVCAQDPQVQKLQQRVMELENRVRDLEASLRSCVESAVAAKGDDLGWQNKKNWRRLELGMPQDQVEAILGEPVKIIRGYRTLWYYPNIYCGYVSFDDEGHLSGWSEP